MIIDANNLILGRLGTYVAKKSLLGEKIDIINCEKAIITGKRKQVLEDYRKSYQMGIPKKGPFFRRMPDRFVKRAIRGMIPYKNERGKIAYSNLKCHVGIPDSLKDKKADTIENANVKKLPTLDYITVKDICSHFGVDIK
ncbi:50S ribosomal protein L13 [Candidatus Woesearchaeota archaeon]|nr:50S ribosomal protein L13 [Candidatus Woesearchaeota archaeon]